VCALMGIAVTGGIEDGFLPRAAAWLAGLGLVIIEIGALIALITRQPISTFMPSGLPFSSLWEVIPLVGWVILTISALNGLRWSGWSKFAPLGMLLAPFAGLLIGVLLGNAYLAVIVMGLVLALLGFAVRNRLEDKRQDTTDYAPRKSVDALNSGAL